MNKITPKTTGKIVAASVHFIPPKPSTFFCTLAAEIFEKYVYIYIPVSVAYLTNAALIKLFGQILLMK